jgi:Ca2+-binding RTX toxin-like protein
MSSPSIRTIDFLIQGEPGALITVTETADGKLDFRLRVTDVITNAADKPDTADLRGLFFQVGDKGLLKGLLISGPNVTACAIKANGVMEVQGDVNMKGEVGKAVGPFDVGIEFGTEGMGKDDIQETTFTLESTAPLTLEFVMQQQLGLRLTSVSDNGEGRRLSLKLTGQLTGTPKVVDPAPTDPTPVDPPPTDPTPETPPPADPEPGVGYDDLIEAGDGNDTIFGGLGNDEMQGEGGDDLIIGGRDNGSLRWESELSVAIGDNLYGNDGRDTYLYKNGDGVDLIWDFQPGQDVIKLSDYTLADVAGFTFVREVSNRIETGSHDKIAIILDEGGDAIVLNDFPAPSADDVAIVFADGSTLSSAQLLELAAANPIAGRSVAPSDVGAAWSAPAVPGSAKPLDLYGGNGEDTLIGGLGDDRLYGNEGINGLNGRGGNDQLFGGNVRDILLGDDGDDIGYGNGGDDLIIGGSGADKLYGAGGVDVIYGDDADEGVDLPTLLTSYTPVPPGEEVSASIRITKNWWGGFQGEITVTAKESVNDWSLFLKSKFNIDSIWGARTVGETSWSDGLAYDLNNAEWNGSLASGQTTTIGFTARTGVNGIVDTAHLLAGLGIAKEISTDALPRESIVKTLGNTMRGYAGADRLTGTTGSDTYYVDSAGDTVIEKSAGGSADTVIASVSHSLARNVEKLSAATGSKGLSLKGNTLNNVITGGTGADKISGNTGMDVLSGGKGKDAFVFDTTLRTTNRDRVTDFNAKDDMIHLDNAIFKKLGGTGKLKKAFFTVGPKATDAKDHIVFNSKTGALYYDADGNGKGAAILFATLSKGLTLTQDDFLVI